MRLAPVITDSKIAEIRDILSEVDTLLRQRLQQLGVEIPHVLLAIAPDGAGIVRSNVGPEGLAEMVELLADIAISAAAQRPDNER